MTLQELSAGYEQAAALLRTRLKTLRRALRAAKEPEEQFRLTRRISVLTQILGEMNALAELTAHYYDRGYYRNEKYTL